MSAEPEQSLEDWIRQRNEEKPMEPLQLKRYPPQSVRWFVIYLIGVMLVCAALAFAGKAEAQTVPTLTFTAETTTGAGSVVPKFTWSTTPAATSCTASGDVAWTGTKAASGNATLAAITSSKTYTLTCSWPGDTTARLSWLAPTTNTDGTPLTDLTGYRVNYGTSASALTQVIQLPNPSLTTYSVTGLAVGTWYFGMKAYNAAGVESDLSNVASKTITATQGINRTVGITVNPKPSSFPIEVE